MSILVKGMEMPIDCGVCDFVSGLICPDGVYLCQAPTDKKTNSIDVTDYVDNESRPDWCPLVEVPPHGRLIDADYVFERLRNKEPEFTEEIGWIKVGMALMRTAPTVIESEE